MKKTILYLFVVFTVCISGCDDEKKLTPSEDDIYGYFVPQGDHDYDAKIVEWKEKYNFFALYKWSPRDLYWSPNGWSESSETKNGYYGEPSDEAYVGHQLDLIEDVFLSFYTESVLRQYIPLKMLLCKELKNIQAGGKSPKRLNIYSNYDLLAFNWGSDTILSLTQEQKEGLKLEYNLTFLLRLKSNDRIPVSTEFFSHSDYSTNMSSTNYYERGFVTYDNGDKTNTDWKHYLEAILSTSYEDLTREVVATDKTFHGILNDVKDKKGLIKKKYTAMINHFKEYGIDLQNIGNATIE